MGNNFFLKQIFLGGNFRDQVLEERYIESKKVWQQILGRKHLGSNFFWMKIRRAKWGTNFF